MNQHSVLIAYLLALGLAQAIFAAFPGIDLAISELFATEGRGFDWVYGTAPTINLVIRRIGEALTVLLLAAFLFGMITGKLRGSDLRLLAYPLLCVALACGAIVNLLLKAHVGRARPDTLVEFGGTAQLTPPWQVVDECARNCSFTSGEVAMAASLAIPALVIVWPHVGRDRARLAASLLVTVYISVTAFYRIGLGRHFLSDAVFSVLISAGVALLLYPLLRIEAARRTLPVLGTRAPAPELAEQRGVY
jgi:lipid A 4'-phosphatase